MMYLHPDRKLVYLAHPKTASRSVREALFERGFVPHGRHPNARPTKCRQQHPPVAPLHHRTLAERPGDGWHVFTTIRNHFDAWASWWSYTAKEGEPFAPAFVERVTSRNPAYWPDPNLMWLQHTRFADTILRFESQEEGLRDLLGDPSLALPRLGVSERREARHYRDMISPELRAYIEKRYGGEMSEQGYSW